MADVRSPLVFALTTRNGGGGSSLRASEIEIISYRSASVEAHVCLSDTVRHQHIQGKAALQRKKEGEGGWEAIRQASRRRVRDRPSSSLRRSSHVHAFRKCGRPKFQSRSVSVHVSHRTRILRDKRSHSIATPQGNADLAPRTSAKVYKRETGQTANKTTKVIHESRFQRGARGEGRKARFQFKSWSVGRACIRDNSSESRLATRDTHPSHAVVRTPHRFRTQNTLFSPADDSGVVCPQARLPIRCKSVLLN